MKTWIVRTDFSIYVLVLFLEMPLTNIRHFLACGVLFVSL